MTNRVQLRGLILNGESGPIAKGCKRDEIVAALGPADIHTAQRGRYPEMLVYGDFEFRFRNGALTFATVTLKGRKLRLHRRRSAAILSELESRGIAYQIDSIMSDESQTVFRTCRGVHLCFVNDRLVKVGVECANDWRVPPERSSR
jgi:hypothetical protein